MSNYVAASTATFLYILVLILVLKSEIMKG